MTDHVTAVKRSQIMSSVGSRNTWPELKLRRILHAMGFRYAMHRADLPGKPDLVFPYRRKVIFVHGCFWHGHSCRGGRPPKSRRSYWMNKQTVNIARDKRCAARLRRAGWGVMTVWQCQLKKPEKTAQRVARFLRDRPSK